MLRLLIPILLTSSVLAQEIVLGPECSIAAQGSFLVVCDPRHKAECLVNLARVALVKAADPNDNNSWTEITLRLDEHDTSCTVIRVQQRDIPYERIKHQLTGALRAPVTAERTEVTPGSDGAVPSGPPLSRR